MTKKILYQNLKQVFKKIFKIDTNKISSKALAKLLQIGTQ